MGPAHCLKQTFAKPFATRLREDEACFHRFGCCAKPGEMFARRGPCEFVLPSPCRCRCHTRCARRRTSANGHCVRERQQPFYEPWPGFANPTSVRHVELYLTLPSKALLCENRCYYLGSFASPVSSSYDMLNAD